MPDPNVPVEVPVPVSDDELFARDEVAFHVTEDQCWRLEVNISNHDINKWREEETPHEMAFLVSAAKRQRSEVKLSQLTSEDRERFEQAKCKEIDSWITTETIARITRNQIPRENVLRCRWILTWKDADASTSPDVPKRFTPKARLVVLGFEDPHVDSIPRDSPTMNRLSRNMILQLASSNAWDIQSFDIKTAFLRGSEQGNRTLGLEPPEEMRLRLKLRQNEIVQLLKGAYGRVDAPFLWFKELQGTLEKLNFTQSPFDPCLFILVDPANNQTIGAIGIHVDDGLCCGSPAFQAKLDQLEAKYPFGSRKKNEFTFTGLRIKQKGDYSIEVNQTQYVKDISAISLSRDRRMLPDAPVSEAERQSLRALVGSLQYAAVNTRPDLCARLGWLQSRINNAQVSTLIEANRTLHEAKQHADTSIHIHPINIKDLRYVAFSDASFASEKNPSSHQGMIIMAADKKIGENERSVINPVIWHSKKIQKVAVSTLSAEAMALAGAVDVLSWVRLMWAWIIDHRCNWKQADETLLKLPPAFSALNPEDEPHVPMPESVDALVKKLPSEQQSIITTDCKNAQGHTAHVQAAAAAKATTSSAPSRPVAGFSNAWEAVTLRLSAEIFGRAKQMQDKVGGTAGAELLHTSLPAEHWGLSRLQLSELATQIHQMVESGDLTNRSRMECRKRKIPYYEARSSGVKCFKSSDEEKFQDVDIGPTMHQVNAEYIQPTTLQTDAVHGIPCLSYALHQNAWGLHCDLFISHAWSEGVFELCHTVDRSWPLQCVGAYICSVANPQNLPELMSPGRGSDLGCQNGFGYSGIHRKDSIESSRREMLMVANSNVPIHSRLWCVYEAHCAKLLKISMSVVGDPAHFATNASASHVALHAIRRAVEAKRRELAIAAASEDAAMEPTGGGGSGGEKDMDIIAAGLYHRRLQRWEKHAQRQTAAAVQRMERALDVRKAGDGGSGSF
eukprot:s1200_g9.t1